MFHSKMSKPKLFHCVCFVFALSLQHIFCQVCCKAHIPDKARHPSGPDTMQQTFCLPETFIIQFGDICKC